MKLASCSASSREWLSRIDKDSKEARNKRIFDLSLACWTQQEIADEVGLSQPQVKELCDSFIDFGNLAKSDKAAADHATDFDTPIYNVWKFKERRLLMVCQVSANLPFLDKLD